MERNSLFERYITSQVKFVSTKKDLFAGKQRRFMVNFAPHLPRDRQARILDLGPGRGELLALLRRLGYQRSLGIDISPEVVEHCNALIPGSAQLVTDTDMYFRTLDRSVDAICASHILEHIPKDELVPLLEAMRQALKPHGKLIIEVPNGDSPLASITRYGDFTHEIAFSERSLRQVLTIAGFASIQVYPSRLPLDHPARLIQIAAQAVIFGGLKILCRVLDTYQPTYMHTSIVCIAQPEKV